MRKYLNNSGKREVRWEGSESGAHRSLGHIWEETVDTIHGSASLILINTGLKNMELREVK